jgi:non-specific serine/threonine protein kinase
MLSIEDHSMLADFVAAEEEDPSPRKVIDESRTVYISRRFRPPTGRNGYGLPILCDFGEAKIGLKHETGPFIQPHIYRAPEIIFQMPRGSLVDIWNLGCLVSDHCATRDPDANFHG